MNPLEAQEQEDVRGRSIGVGWILASVKEHARGVQEQVVREMKLGPRKRLHYEA